MTEPGEEQGRRVVPPGWRLHLDRTTARIHAGKLFLADMTQDLPARFVKRIDRFALKVLKSHRRRYCL